MRYSIYQRVRFGFPVRPKQYWEEWLKQTRMSFPYEGNQYAHAAKMRASNARRTRQYLDHRIIGCSSEKSFCQIRKLPAVGYLADSGRYIRPMEVLWQNNTQQM
jgi:hypothetical protein